MFMKIRIGINTNGELNNTELETFKSGLMVVFAPKNIGAVRMRGVIGCAFE